MVSNPTGRPSRRSAATSTSRASPRGGERRRTLCSRCRMIAMPDLNNPPGGPHLIVTAKTANKVQFFDAATLAKTGEIDMPASTHEMILSPDGKKVFASVYGGGI